MKDYFFQKRGWMIVILTLLPFMAASLPSQACAHKSCKSDVCGSQIPPCHEAHKVSSQKSSKESCQICLCCVARDYVNDTGQMIGGPSVADQIKKQSNTLAHVRSAFFDGWTLVSSLRPPGEIQGMIHATSPFYISHQSFLI
ncbi:MAG: hypothetical protein A3F89_05270 [Deltaproteobacteria bacterium RIFCSPLOWO2_12_FULL_50_11]|nr:MAG: hypothetical protein A3F89_05270 [Deltaproteobacteria bacterium RIFCSPLOWO2_12_FULL_50_11]